MTEEPSIKTAKKSPLKFHKERVDEKPNGLTSSSACDRVCHSCLSNQKGFNQTNRDERLNKIQSTNFHRGQFRNETYFLKRNSPAATAIGRCAEYTK